MKYKLPVALNGTSDSLHFYLHKAVGELSNLLLREVKPLSFEAQSRSLLEEKVLRPNRVFRVCTISIDLRHRYTTLSKERESSGLACGGEILMYGDMIGNFRDHLEAVLELKKEDAIGTTFSNPEYFLDLSMSFAHCDLGY